MAGNDVDSDIFESIKKMVETDENSSVLELTEMIGDDGKIVKISKSALDDQQGETDVTTFLKLMQTNNKDLNVLLPDHLRKEFIAQESNYVNDKAGNKRNTIIQRDVSQDIIADNSQNSVGTDQRDIRSGVENNKAVDKKIAEDLKKSDKEEIVPKHAIIEKNPEIIKQILRSNIVKSDIENIGEKMTENTISNLTKHFDDATKFDGNGDYIKKIVQSYVKSYLADVLPDLVRKTVEEEVKNMLKNMG